MSGTGARAGLKWVAALEALLDGRAAHAERLFDECEAEAVRFGGSNAQRDIIPETKRARRLPAG